MITLWIDPDYGKRGKGCGCALYEGRTLIDAWHGDPGVHQIPGLVCVTYELPQADKRSYGFSPEVLINLTAAGAELAGLYAGANGAELRRSRPREWKGSQAKPKMHARLWAALTPAERDLLGGANTAATIDAAVTAGALRRWPSGVDFYPKDWAVADLLDAASMGALYHGRMI